MNFISIILVVFISKVCNSTIMHSVEGRSMKFNISYPCNSSSVTLQLGIGDPFFISSSSFQREWLETKIDYLMVKEFRFESHCGIKVWLNPVKKIHEGTYIRFSYSDDEILPEMARIGLRVARPPGKASCALSNEDTDNTDEQWVFLKCIASVDDVAGYIKCFQNGVSVSAITPPTENDQILQQTFLVSPTHPVHCCSSTVEQPKSMCECRDVLWNPSLREEANNHCQDTLTTSQTITDDTLISTPLILYTVAMEDAGDAAKGMSGVSVFLIVFLVVSYAVFAVIITRLILAQSGRGQQGAEAEANSTSVADHSDPASRLTVSLDC